MTADEGWTLGAVRADCPGVLHADGPAAAGVDASRTAMALLLGAVQARQEAGDGPAAGSSEFVTMLEQVRALLPGATCDACMRLTLVSAMTAVVDLFGPDMRTQIADALRTNLMSAAGFEWTGGGPSGVD